MNEEEKQEIKELINLLYNNHISQYGKRKLENYIKELQKELDKKDKVISLMTKAIFYEDNSNSELRKLSTCEIIKEYFYKKVEEENETN